MRTFERICQEEFDIRAGDDSRWVVLNAKGWESTRDNVLRDFLRYVRTGEADGKISQEIDSRVREYNNDREWVTRVLTFEQDAKIQCNRARKEGREEGMDELGALIAQLLAEGKIEEATRVAKDASYRDRLLAERGTR